MKKALLITASFLMLIVFNMDLKAQESSWDTGTDLVSSYVWRGAKFGSGPALQPWVEFSTGGFAVGAWGSYCISVDEAMEADLYMSYSTDFGLSLTVTDYYFPPSEFFDGDSHFFEPMASIGLGSFTFTGAYMMGKDVSDLYVEAALSAGPVDLTIGAGDGAYTVDGDFSVCNIGIGTSKEIKFSESFSLPVSGAVILNPSSEQFHIVVGISL